MRWLRPENLDCRGGVILLSRTFRKRRRRNDDYGLVGHRRSIRASSGRAEQLSLDLYRLPDHRRFEYRSNSS
jgi:hypothetical protein